MASPTTPEKDRQPAEPKTPAPPEGQAPVDEDLVIDPDTRLRDVLIGPGAARRLE